MSETRESSRLTFFVLLIIREKPPRNTGFSKFVTSIALFDRAAVIPCRPMMNNHRNKVNFVPPME